MCTRNLVLHKEKMVRPDHCPSVFAHSQQQTESQLLRVGSSYIPTVNIIKELIQLGMKFTGLGF